MWFLRNTIACPLAYEKIPLSTPVENLKFIVLDTETTGFHLASEDRLIEIGAVAVDGLQVDEEDRFHTYVNPKRQISREIVELTSITEECVKSAPDAVEAISRLFAFVEERESVCFVGHYISFDALVLKSELKRGNLGLKNLFTIDTLDLIGFLAPSYDMRDLACYARAFGTRMYQRHQAVSDALTTAYLFVELLLQLKDRGCLTWGELIQATESQARYLQY